MGFLILDTDKQSTSSLRLQLGAISRIPVQAVKDSAAFTRLLARRIPPPAVIFLDEDGDPDKVASFRAEIEFTGASSIVMILGSGRKSPVDPNVRYLSAKARLHRKLESALMASHALGQQQHAAVGYIGESVPSDLVREVGRAPGLERNRTGRHKLDELTRRSGASAWSSLCRGICLVRILRWSTGCIDIRRRFELPS